MTSTFTSAIPSLFVIFAGLALASAEPVKVSIEKHEGNYQLIHAGEPYFIKGAGGGASLDVLKQCGGNSIRTWGSDISEELLDQAHRLGLTVTIGFWVGHAERGFDYNDSDAVAAQLAKAKETVLKYRNHPALLMWAFGNEMEGYAEGDNPKIWKAVDGMAKMAHELDPNHPTMTVMAELGGSRVECVHAFCPNIDVVGINSYGGGPSIAERYRKAGGVKPFVVTEFGPPGTWEVKLDQFKVPHEMSSTEKSAWYRRVYEQTMLKEKGKLCLGSYAFAWGRKQEATATWFGMFLHDGTRLQVVDTMAELWGGKLPKVRCPVVEPLTADHEMVDPGGTIHATLKASHPDQRPLKTTWVLARDAGQYQTGGEFQPEQEKFPDSIASGDNTGCELKMPTDGGGYWLYAYVYDDAGGAAVTNIPLHVRGDPPSPKAQKATLPLVLYGPGQKELPYVWSGWMSGSMKALHMDEKSTTQPHAGDSCMSCQLDDPHGWGGIVWQSPANDWGEKFGGYDLTGATKLTFWARGDTGNESVNFRIGVLGKEKKFHDSDSATLADVRLTKDWKQYSIDLSGRNLTCIKTGFSWSVATNGQPIKFYLSEVQYEK